MDDFYTVARDGTIFYPMTKDDGTTETEAELLTRVREYNEGL